MPTPKTIKQDKLIFIKIVFESRNVRVRIDDDAADIVNSIWLQTGISATEIVSEMIRYAKKYTEISKT